MYWATKDVSTTVLYNVVTNGLINLPAFFSIRDDGTNLYFEFSADGGQNWDIVHQHARTTYLPNPNAFGFGISGSNAGAKRRLNAIHWSIS